MLSQTKRGCSVDLVALLHIKDVLVILDFTIELLILQKYIMEIIF